jgi:hypothetical protein
MDLKTYLDIIGLYPCKSCAHLFGDSTEDFGCDNRSCSGWNEYDRLSEKMETQESCEHNKHGYIKIDNVTYWKCLDCLTVRLVKDERPQILIDMES